MEAYPDAGRPPCWMRRGERARLRDPSQQIPSQKIAPQNFHRIFLGVKMLAKLLRSWASDRSAYSRFALCDCLVTIATHVLSQTVSLCFGALATVPDANAIQQPRTYSGFRDYPSKSAHIDERAACNKQGTVTRIATIDLSTADNVEALRCTSARNEDSPDARAENDTAVAMEGEIMSQMAGGGAGQHTTQANETLPFAGATSRSGHDTWTHAPRDTTSSRSYRRGPKERQTFYRATGNGRSTVGNHTSTSGTPAAAATETTTPSTGGKGTERDWP